MTVPEQIKSAGTIIVTVLIFILVGFWSILLAQRLGQAPTFAPDGKTISIDEFARAKEIFVIVFPLLTTAAGFWLGSQGTAKAEEKTADAQQQADKAKENEKRLAAAATPQIVQDAIDNYGYKIGPES